MELVIKIDKLSDFKILRPLLQRLGIPFVEKQRKKMHTTIYQSLC